jgi:hypothetical protein
MGLASTYQLGWDDFCEPVQATVGLYNQLFGF